MNVCTWVLKHSTFRWPGKEVKPFLGEEQRDLSKQKIQKLVLTFKSRPCGAEVVGSLSWRSAWSSEFQHTM